MGDRLGCRDGPTRHRRSIDIIFTDDRILHFGPGFAGIADRTLDGHDLMVMPGLVDVHSHLGHEPAYRGIREEHGVPSMYMTGLYERSQAFDTTDPALRGAATEVALCELLKSGVTSICDITAPYEGWIETMARSGIRSFLAPGFASARWRLENGHSVGFAWDEAGGRRGLDTALALIDGVAVHPSGRLSGIVSPMQIENCADDLLRTAGPLHLSEASPSPCISPKVFLSCRRWCAVTGSRQPATRPTSGYSGREPS